MTRVCACALQNTMSVTARIINLFFIFIKLFFKVLLLLQMPNILLFCKTHCFHKKKHELLQHIEYQHVAQWLLLGPENSVFFTAKTSAAGPPKKKQAAKVLIANCQILIKQCVSTFSTPDSVRGCGQSVSGQEELPANSCAEP